ncbi:MAG: hypothetical protein WBF53_00695 [Litorimonas sp.]
MAETELERAEKRYAQAKARLQALRNRETTRQRKMETRRKVILGGAQMDLAERNTGAATMLVQPAATCLPEPPTVLALCHARPSRRPHCRPHSSICATLPLRHRSIATTG